MGGRLRLVDDVIRVALRAVAKLPREKRPLIYLCDEHGKRTTPKKVLTPLANVVYFPGEVTDTLSTVVAIEMPNQPKAIYRSIFKDTVHGVRPTRDQHGNFVGNITVQF